MHYSIFHHVFPLSVISNCYFCILFMLIVLKEGPRKTVVIQNGLPSLKKELSYLLTCLSK